MRIPIARYGLPEIAAGTALCAGAAALCTWWFPPLAAVPAAAWTCLLVFFRDPERPCGGGPRELLSPADGTVADVEQVQAHAFIEGPCVRIGIFMSLWDVHVNRSPAAGTVRFVRYCPGAFRHARSNPARAENEHSLIGLQMPGGRQILINQIAGIVARRAVCAVGEGQDVRRGERIGMVKFGSRVELYMALKDRPAVRVKVGDRVKAGLDVVASYEPGPDG